MTMTLSQTMTQAILLVITLLLWPANSQTLPPLRETSTRPPLLRRSATTESLSGISGVLPGMPHTRPPAVHRRDLFGNWQAVVYLADARSPAQVKMDKGFLPRRTPRLDDAFLLFRYAFSGGDESVFLSTTRDFMRAVSMAAGFESGGWVYLIYPSPNMFDLSRSLDGHAPAAANNTVVAIGGIHWSQVLSSVYIPPGRSPSTISPKALLSREFLVANPDFDRSWTHLPLTKPQTRLAGFCGQFCAAEMKRRVEGFMGGLPKLVGWRGQWPLFISPEKVVRARALIRMKEGLGV